MDRAEVRRAKRVLGFRGSKAKRQRKAPPEAAQAFREAVKARAERFDSLTQPKPSGRLWTP